jgi:putative hydrolase of the HAD superfamily
VKAVIFDAGNVVVKFDIHRALELFVPLCRARVPEVVAFFTSSEADRAFVEGRISIEEFFAAAERVLGFDMTVDAFARIYNDIFSPQEAVERIIRSLKGRYTLALLSNTNALHFPFLLERYPIMRLFDYRILSYEEKCQKPQYELFQRTIHRIGVAPQQAVFIDDIEENVVGAAQLGIRAILFTTPEELIEKLAKYGVRV